MNWLYALGIPLAILASLAGFVVGVLIKDGSLRRLRPFTYRRKHIGYVKGGLGADKTLTTLFRNEEEWVSTSRTFWTRRSVRREIRTLDGSAVRMTPGFLYEWEIVNRWRTQWKPWTYEVRVMNEPGGQLGWMASHVYFWTQSDAIKAARAYEDTFGDLGVTPEHFGVTRTVRR